MGGGGGVDAGPEIMLVELLIAVVLVLGVIL